MNDTMDEDQRPPDQRTPPSTPPCPLASGVAAARQNRRPRGDDGRRSDGDTTINQWGRAQHNNLPVLGAVVTEAAGVVEEAAMTAATAAALVRCWWGNREGKWKRLLSRGKRSGRHTNEGGTPDKKGPTATAGGSP